MAARDGQGGGIMTALAELDEAHSVVLLDPNKLPDHQEEIFPLIEKACAYSKGQFSLQGVVDGVLSGRYRMLAYLADDQVVSIAVLHVCQFDTGLRVMEILLASGNSLRDWTHFEPQVEAYAKAQGCSRFRMIGRDGLQRMLPSYKRVAVVLEKEFA
jgi:hypothetical protein